MTATAYEKNANDLIAEMGVTFRTTLIGSGCPMFCEYKRNPDGALHFPRRTHIHGKHYLCTFTRGKRTLSVDFWNSYQDEEFNAWRFEPRQLVNAHDSPYWDKFRRDRLGKRRVPTAYDVLACVQKNDPGEFEEWEFEEFCEDIGYDTDSRTAERIFEAIRAEWRKVTGFFTAEEIAKLQEIA